MNCKYTVLKKALMDQILYAPFSIAVFFSYASYLDVGEFGGLHFQNKMNDALFTTWLADCTFWPFVNVANFRYIPLNYRPTFIGIAQLLWQIYLSSVGHKRKSSPHDDGEKERGSVQIDYT
jgi:protein Mpv17